MSTRTILTVCATSALLLGVILAAASAPTWGVVGVFALAAITAVGIVAAPRDNERSPS